MPHSTPGRPWPYPRFIAHRGGGVLAPENTLAGFREGLRYGYRGAECDVKLSADNVCFLLHDDTVERTSNGGGAAAALSMAQLARLDAGRWKGAAFAGEPMPTLDNVAAYCLAHGIALNIEIKPCPGRETETGAAVAAEAARLWAGAAQPPLLSSFSAEALRAARESAPQLPRAWLVERAPADWLARLRELGCVALHCDHLGLDAALAAGVKQAGFQLLCYTVNLPADAERLLAWGVDSVCTDRLDLLRPISD
ncbi:glycerophosphoryl diester phosphodiesterase [Chromobacterium alkanivorans]|uniref:glycerophosphodiester phosphodiesterase n=1 Tax=Chromobacterium alkanivorans TaxID=1071719 RepID=UPI0021686C34|nr:glycerophosphodiester phosphodiesterase [Chromobacterium alkanivorans]MCS3802381.1 glycerophosphoryl diester phosphodiesterase [Chromobacterium alkanivorans]MCS3816708.1 glycerophosphoryl diester phosphodiesterase [Chromobacterium alkanivorans]MCS3871747.1 glycerophosphoryl diester phosphodiesterase [Chromobacterium alkanivorans]